MAGSLFCFILVFVSLWARSEACDSMTSVEVDRQRPKFHPEYSQMSDFWLGELEFVDFFCGWPYDISERQRRSVDADGNVVAERLTPAEVNTLKLDHSMVYFRGHSFEWGASMMVSFNSGTINRNARECPAVWSRQGNSACSLEQAEALAAKFFEIFGPYNLLTNNCHNFADWFMRNLSEGRCKF